MSLTKVSYSMISSALTSVVDFGAKGDGVTDDTAAIQAAVDYVTTNNGSAVFFPLAKGQRYKITSTININRADIALVGDAGTAANLTNCGYIFSPTASLVFFNFIDPAVGGYGCFHMNFYGHGNTNTQTAIKFSETANAPSRPLVIRDTTAIGFYSAIWLTNNTNTLTPAWVDVQDCTFKEGTYAILGDENCQTLGLRFVNNVSENGGKIKGNFSNFCEITNCLIEGQSNFLELIGTGGGHLIMRDNYLEVNDGDYVAKMNLSNKSLCVAEIDYFYTWRGTRTDDFVFYGGGLVCKGNFQSRQVTVKGNISANSFNVKNYKVTLTNLATSTLKANDFVGVASPAVFRTDNMGGAVTVQAPHGQVTTAVELTSAGYTGYTTVTTNYSAGDLITISYLVRSLDNSVPTNWTQFFIQALTQNFALPVIDGGIESFFAFNLNQEWNLVTITNIAQNGGTGLKIRCNPYFGATVAGAGIQIAGLAVNVITSPASREVVAPLYPVV